MLDQRSWEDVHQLRQHVEATLTRLHTFLLQLLVESFNDDGNLQTENVRVLLPVRWKTGSERHLLLRNSNHRLINR